MIPSADQETILTSALEASIYVSPDDHGLTEEELFEVASRFEIPRGHVIDILKRFPRLTGVSTDGNRFVAGHGLVSAGFGAGDAYQHDQRDPKAFEAVIQQLQSSIANHGREQAALDRSVIIARGVADGVPEQAMKVALIIQEAARILVRTREGLIRLANGKETWPLPSRQRRERIYGLQERKRPHFAKLLEVVKDVIARRTDGRPASFESIKAFEGKLEELGHGRFRAWWAQTASELSHTQNNHSPTTVCVLSAALAEAALTFVVKRAQDLGLATLASTDFKSKKPDAWKLLDLINSAAAGQDDAILKHGLKEKATRLNNVRQRIHAGRLMTDYTGVIPDIRPEEPRDARAALDEILRAILDWLHKHPAKKADGAS